MLKISQKNYVPLCLPRLQEGEFEKKNIQQSFNIRHDQVAGLWMTCQRHQKLLINMQSFRSKKCSKFHRKTMCNFLLVFINPIKDRCCHVIYYQSVKSILTVPVGNRVNGESLRIFSFFMFESGYFPNEIIRNGLLWLLW